MPRPATATRERILTAAFARFAHYGFRRTSMEDIAAEAGVSRAALYLQFRNKEEIFRSLAEQLHAEALAQAEAALRTGGSLAERLRAAVEAKTLRFVEIAYGSSHGGELLDESNRLCGDLAARSEHRFRELVTGVLRQAARRGEIDLAPLGLSATEVGELFVRSLSGLKGPGVTVQAYRRRLAALVQLLTAGLGSRARAGARRAPSAAVRASGAPS